MHKGTLEFSLTKTSCTVILTGEVTWEISPDLDAFLNSVFDDILLKTVYFDLSKTTYMDSTSLGVLAHFKRITMDTSIKTSILNPSELIIDNLQEIGLAKIYKVEYREVPANADVHPILSLSKYSCKDMSTLVKKTHRALIDLNDKNREQFGTIVKLVEDEEKKQE